MEETNETVNISLHRYENYKKIEKSLKDKQILVYTNYGRCISFIEPDDAVRVLFEKIKEQDDEIKKMTLENYELKYKKKRWF